MQNGSGFTAINIAHYPQYDTITKRLRTFDDRWPDSVPQTPETFAESGFFYTGFEDCVRCFHCGIGLRNWEALDNPNQEHAIWSGTCAFLINVIGQNLVSLYLDNAIQMLNDEQHHHNVRTVTRRPNIALSVSVRTESNILNRSDMDVVHKDNLMETEGAATNLIRGRRYRDSGVGKVLNPTESNNINELTFDRDNEQGLSDLGERTGRHQDRLHASTHTEYIRNRPGLYVPKENRHEEMGARKICKICSREMTLIALIFIPCGHLHLGVCAECGPLLRKCPECNMMIIGYRECLF